MGTDVDNDDLFMFHTISVGIGDDTNDDIDFCLMTVTCFYFDDLAIAANPDRHRRSKEE